MRSWPLARDFLSYWLPPCLGVAAILSLSGDLGSSARTLTLLERLLFWVPFLKAHLEMVNAVLRKAGHVLGYGVLCFLWFRAFQGQQGYGRGKSLLCSLALCLAVALTDEVHQSLVNSRTGSLRDVALDLAGATLGAVLTLRRWSPPPRASWGEGEEGRGPGKI